MDHFTDIATAMAGAFTPLGTSERTCESHGLYAATGTRLSKGREVWTRCPQCEADDRAAEEQRRVERIAEALKADLAAKLGETLVPPRFHGKTLDNFNADSDPQRYALTVARDFIENFPKRLERGEGLIFSGLPGTGKSHIAGAILQSLLPKYVGKYCTCMGLIRAVRGTWRKDSERSETEVLNILADVPLLVIDEIGVQYGTDGEQTILFDVLDGRYRNMMPTILMTNQDKAGLKQFIGERAYDRLTETSRWVAFDWSSYRAQARRDAA